MPYNQTTGECEAKAFLEFIQNCHNHSPTYQDYVLTSIVIIMCFITSMILLAGVIWLLYLIPSCVGNWWLVNRKKSSSRRYYKEFFPSWPVDWKMLVAGYLLIFISISAIVALVVGLYWFGHLFI